MSITRSLSRAGGFLLREDLVHRGEDVIDTTQPEHLHELPDVFRVAGPGCKRLNGQQMLGRGGEDAQARVVEHPGSRRGRRQV